MLHHHLTLFIRNIKKDKGTFLINIIGLSSGLACVLLIYLWVHDELSMDQFHVHDHRLYQVRTNFHGPDAIETWEGTPIPLGETFMEMFPQVESATLLNDRHLPMGTISFEDHSLEAKRMFTDERFFEVLSYTLLQGDSRYVLADKHNIVLSEALALKLFKSTEDVIGKTISWSNPYLTESYQVSGIFSTVDAHSSKQFDALFHHEVILEVDRYANLWSTNPAETILLVHEESNMDDLHAQIEYFIWTKNPRRKTNRLLFQRYSKKYLSGNYENGVQAGGRITYVKLFSIIALFILLIACINFMNLSTAQASQKMREIGVKKALGASQGTLMWQFLLESMLLVFLALIVAVGLAYFLLPHFNEITEKSLELIPDSRMIVSILGIGLLTALLAGAYPAFYLSSFNPVDVLKGQRKTSLTEEWVRKVLVIFQFALSVIFIVGVMVVDQQIQYTQSKNMGFSRDNIISFYRPRHNDDLEVFLGEIKRISGVEQASNMRRSILDGRDDAGGYSWRGEALDEKWIFKSPQISFDIIEMLGMEMLQGRSFSRDYQDDDSKIIINESARKMMELEDPIGQMIKCCNDRQVEVIGVVKDFNYGSLHHRIKPMIVRLRHYGRNILVKIVPGTERQTLKELEKVFQEFHPGYAFTFSFLDAENQRLYESENRVAILSKYFSALAIIISCLGLFGLAMFTSERRKKEIGIRKALGQSSTEVSLLLTSEFAKLVLVSIVIGLPVAYEITNIWLSTFAYKIALTPGYFLLAGIIALVVALVAVGAQSVRAANKNPIDALREE